MQHSSGDALVTSPDESPVDFLRAKVFGGDCGKRFGPCCAVTSPICFSTQTHSSVFKTSAWPEQALFCGRSSREANNSPIPRPALRRAREPAARRLLFCPLPTICGRDDRSGAARHGDTAVWGPVNTALPTTMNHDVSRVQRSSQPGQVVLNNYLISRNK